MSNHLPSDHQELIKEASLPPGEGPERFSPSSIKDWQPRRKSVSNACERCRRRKIRCDGNTPCATCNRFSLQCIRTQKLREVVASEHQAALEGRIHQLEAQLAAHVNAPMHGMESISEDVVAGPSSFDWQSPSPSLTLDTRFPSSYRAGSGVDLASFSAGSVPPASFNRFEPRPSILSPESPAPSFWSGTTRGSSPDLLPAAPAPQYPPNLTVYQTAQDFPQPAPVRPVPSWEFMAQHSQGLLKPPAQSGAQSRTSRTSSVSSASVESEDPALLSMAENESDVDMLPLGPAPRLPRQGIFAANAKVETPSPGPSRAGFSDRSRAMNVIPFPSRFEAETLTTEFVQYIQTLEDPKPYTISPGTFSRFCSMVYPDPQSRSTSVDASVSVPMARFHVFLAMAIGMKIRIRDSTEPTNSLLDRCYELAIQQASSSVFWSEQGGVEATQLINIFASIKKDPNFEPKPLSSSLSW